MFDLTQLILLKKTSVDGDHKFLLFIAKVTDICGYFWCPLHDAIIGLDYQVEEEEEQEGTSAYFKQGTRII